MSKSWSSKAINNYIGNFNYSGIGYAKSPKTRLNAASGGIVSALLINELESKTINKAIVCKSHIKENKINGEFFFAKTKLDILKAQGSKYLNLNFEKEVLSLLKSTTATDKIAIVGLPCNIRFVNNILKHKTKIKGKVVFTISLFCGHASAPILTEKIINKLPLGKNNLDSYRYREGHWRGNLKAVYKNGLVTKKPFAFFSLYQNLFFFAETKCLSCHDHFGYEADINIGDIWNKKAKKNPIKHSAIIVKNEIGNKVIEKAYSKKTIVFKKSRINDILDGQKRSAPPHYNVSARTKAGKILGLKIKDTVETKVKWNEFLSALIIVFNWKWSQSKKYSDIIFKIPRKILKIYLYILKGLQSL